LKPGYVEEGWEKEINKKGIEVEDKFSVSFEKAYEISKELDVPLHPSYIYYWTQIDRKQFFGLVDWICHGEMSGKRVILPYTESDRERFIEGKRALELLGVEHSMSIEHVVLDKVESEGFLFNLGFENDFKSFIDGLAGKIKDSNQEGVLEIVNGLCSLVIKDKAGTFIGTRMGRPEKAKLRKLTGSPHVLFPVGKEGGRLRSFQAALGVGYVKGDFPNYFCEACGLEGIFPRCLECGGSCVKKKIGGKDFSERKIDIRNYFDGAKKLVGVRIEDIQIVKGVRGMSNKDHSIEHLAKGLLRAKHGLNVNKDGTVRYDMTEMTLTHFKPLEVGTSVEKLIEMGYDKDIDGKSLKRGDQILELFPHDVVLPACPETSRSRWMTKNRSSSN